MNPVLERRALEVMDEALTQPVTARKRWLETACGGDKDLLAAVTRLLTADLRASAILPTEPPEPIEFAELDPPARVGPYRLDRLLGRGGMGEVYLGVRDDGLFDQQVAVKLLRPSVFPGASQRYFESERRLLATLRHPGIARILDGGVEDGRPYFIMELVQGEAIDAYAAAQDLSLRQIAALVARLCRSVQAAHQALVVHADIKPSNVMVEPDGDPRLLDFGIACLAGDESDTETTAFPATPAFASPQRLDGERPTTADDIYALGALLRVLATGETAPGDRTVSAAIGAGFAERDPRWRRRRARLAEGDLDAIVARAMHTDPAARYATAQGLGDDLERWIRHEPLAARAQAGFLYGAGKFMRRRPWITAATLTATVAVLGATSLITGLYLEARQARAAAETRFTDARTMANYLLFDVYDRLARSPQTLATRQDIARVGERFLVSLSGDASAPLDVRLEAIEGLIRLSELQGGAGRNLGRPAEARTNLARAARLQADLARAAPNRADVAVAGARIAIARATIVMFVEMAPERAEEILIAARYDVERALQLAPGDPNVRTVRMYWLVSWSLLRQWQARYPESIDSAREGLTQWRALPPEQRNSVQSRVMAARAYDALAESTFYQGDHAGSVAPYEASLALRQALLAEQPRDPQRRLDLARAQWQVGSTLVQLDRDAEALTILQAGLANAREVEAFDSNDAGAQRQVRILMTATAQALAGLGRFDEAIPMLRASLEARRQVMLRNPGEPQAVRDYTVALGGLGDVLSDAGRRDEACATLAQATQAFERLRRSGALTSFDLDYPMQTLNESLRRNRCG